MSYDPIIANLKELSNMTELEAFLRITLVCGIDHKWRLFEEKCDKTSEFINEMYYRGNSVLVKYASDGTITLIKHYGVDYNEVRWFGQKTRYQPNQDAIESIGETLLKYHQKK